MTREKKLFLNITSSLIYQVISLICGFILPRFILYFFGSKINGLVSSITQFLGIISLAECGVGSVVQSALYMPLAKKDKTEISEIIVSSKRFFRKIALIFIFYTIILAGIYPLFSPESFDFWFTSSLVVIISLSSFVQYYFCISYSLLLSADAMGFVNMNIHSLSLILNTIVSIFLIEKGASIHIVEIFSSIIFLLQPICLCYFVNNHYHLNKHVVLKSEPIKQKWNGFLQHIAAVVLDNTDVIVLTLFSSLENVSIYSIYYLVVNGIKRIVVSLTNGISALFGEMYAKNEKEILNETFSKVEWVIHTVVTFLFNCTGILILPFVSIYTKDIIDVNYIVPLFGVMITLAQASYCLRLPYSMMVLAAGHYKQTQLSALIEMTINIVVSIFFVKKYGLIGVSFGTLLAMFYRTIYYAMYLSKNIINRSFLFFIKHIFVDFLSTIAIIFLSRLINLSCNNYQIWFLKAFEVSCLALIVSFFINFIFYKNLIVELIKKIKTKLKF